jgi:hypothetical protein
MADIILPRVKKRENPDVANKPVGTAKSAKFSSPISVLAVPSGPVDHVPVQDNLLTQKHLLEMPEEDKMSLYYSWCRSQFIKSTQPAGRVLKHVHLTAMDLGMLHHLFMEWNDIVDDSELREVCHNHLLDMEEENKMLLYYSWRRFQFHNSTQPAGRVLKNIHLVAMDTGTLRHLFLEWNLLEADKIREGEEQEYHEKIASEMENIDHEDYNTPPSSTNSSCV